MDAAQVVVAIYLGGLFLYIGIDIYQELVGKRRVK